MNINKPFCDAIIAQLIDDEYNEEGQSIHPETLLKDELGIDSLHMVDMTALARQVFHTRVDVRDLEGVITVADLARVIEEKGGYLE